MITKCERMQNNALISFTRSSRDIKEVLLESHSIKNNTWVVFRTVSQQLGYLQGKNKYSLIPTFWFPDPVDLLVCMKPMRVDTSVIVPVTIMMAWKRIFTTNTWSIFRRLFTNSSRPFGALSMYCKTVQSELMEYWYFWAGDHICAKSGGPGHYWC